MATQRESISLKYSKALRKATRIVSKKRLHRIIKRQLRAAFKRTTQTSQLFPKTPMIDIELLVEHRAEVQAFRYYGYEKTGYAICPNCDYAMEREYQHHCEECGQLLAWNKFSQGRVLIQRTIKNNSESRNAIRPDSLETTHSV